MLSRGLCKMLDNENILTCEVNSVLIKLNERQVNKNSEPRFALTIENEVHELVSNSQAQSQSTKTKTILRCEHF